MHWRSIGVVEKKKKLFLSTYNDRFLNKVFFSTKLQRHLKKNQMHKKVISLSLFNNNKNKTKNVVKYVHFIVWKVQWKIYYLSKLF